MAADLTAVLGADTSQLRSEIKSAKESLKGYKSEVDKLSGSNSNSTKAIDKARNAIHQQSQTYKGAKIQVKKLEESIKDLQYQFNNLDNKAKSATFGKEFKRTISEAENKITSLKSKILEVDFGNSKLGKLGEAINKISPKLGSLFSKGAIGVYDFIGKIGKATGLSKVFGGTFSALLPKITNFWTAITAGAVEYTKEVIRAAEATNKVQTNLGTNRADASAISSQAKGISDTYGADFEETTRAIKTIMDKYKVSAKQAGDFISKGFANGANGNKQYLDNIYEYIPQLAEANYNLEQAGAMLIKQGQSAYNDKLVDTSKELNIRLRAMNSTTKGALAALKLDWKAIQSLMDSGKEPEAIAMIVSRVKALGASSVVARKAMSDLGGAMAEDLGYQQFVEGLDVSDAAIQKLNNSETDLAKSNQELAASSVKLEESWNNALGADGGGLSQIWIDTKIVALECFAALVKGIGYVGKGVRLLWNAIEIVFVDTAASIVDFTVAAGNALEALARGDWEGASEAFKKGWRTAMSHFESDAEDIKNTLTDVKDTAEDAAEEVDLKVKVEGTEEGKKAITTISDAVIKAKDKFSKLQAEWKSLKTNAAKTDWVKRNQEAFKSLGLSINSAAQAQSAFVTSTEAAIAAVEKQARANAARALLEEEYKKQLQNQRKVNKYNPTKSLVAGKSPVPLALKNDPRFQKGGLNVDANGILTALGVSVAQANVEKSLTLKDTPYMEYLKSFVDTGGPYTPGSNNSSSGSRGGSKTTKVTKEDTPNEQQYLQNTKAYWEAIKQAWTTEKNTGIQTYKENTDKTRIGELVYSDSKKTKGIPTPYSQEELQAKIDEADINIKSFDLPQETQKLLTDTVNTIVEKEAERKKANKEALEWNKQHPDNIREVSEGYIPVNYNGIFEGLDVSKPEDRAESYRRQQDANSEVKQKYLDRVIDIEGEIKKYEEILAQIENSGVELNDAQKKQVAVIQDHIKVLNIRRKSDLDAAEANDTYVADLREGEGKAELKGKGALVKGEWYRETGHFWQDEDVDRMHLVEDKTPLQKMWEGYMHKNKAVFETLQDLASLGIKTDINGKETYTKKYANDIAALQQGIATFSVEHSAGYDDPDLQAQIKQFTPKEYKNMSLVDSYGIIMGKILEGVATADEEAFAKIIADASGVASQHEAHLKVVKTKGILKGQKKESRTAYDKANVAQAEFNARNADWDAFKGVVSGADTAVNAIDSVKSSWDSFKDALEEGDAYTTVIAGFNAMMSPIKAFIEVYEMVNSLLKIFKTASSAASAVEVAETNAKIANTAAITANTAAATANGTAKVAANSAIAASNATLTGAIVAANATIMGSNATLGASAAILAGVRATAAAADVPFPATAAAIAANLSSVAGALATAQTFGALGAFADGGIVANGSKIGDYNLARVNGGEMILNGSQQARLFSLLNGNTTRPLSIKEHGHVDFRIKGKNLVGTLSNYNKKQSRL